MPIDLQEIIDAEVAAFITELGDNAEQIAVATCRVDTGTLRSTIEGEHLDGGRTFELSYGGQRAPYAVYIEERYQTLEQAIEVAIQAATI